MLDFEELKEHRNMVLGAVEFIGVEEDFKILMDELLRMRKDKYELKQALIEKTGRGSYGYTIPHESFDE